MEVIESICNWVCIGAFLVASLACAAVGLRSHHLVRKSAGPRESWVWFIIGGAYLLMAGLKMEHFILQLAEWAREESRVEDIYDDRRIFQLAVVAVSTLLAIWVIVYF